MDKTKSSALKGMAVLMVIVSHFPKILVLPGMLNNMLSPLGYHGVAIFLLLSGYGCNKSIQNKSIINFCTRRVLSIVPELVIVTLVSICFEFLINGTHYSIVQITLNALGIRSDILELTWYILFQYVCYIGLCIMMIIPFLKKRPVMFALLFALIVFLICLLPAESIRSITIYWGINFASFSAGILLAEENTGLHKLISNLKTTFFSLIPLVIWGGFFGLIYFVLGNPNEILLRNMLKGLLSCWFAISVYSIFTHISVKPVENILANVGKYSYELYLTHGVFVFIIPSFFKYGYVMIIPFFIIIFISSMALKKMRNLFGKRKYILQGVEGSKSDVDAGNHLSEWANQREVL